MLKTDPKPVTKTYSKAHPLVGKAFLTKDTAGETKWQGTVLADLGDGYFLVQLYEWFMGQASTQHVVAISEMVAKTDTDAPPFAFFDSDEARNDWYERHPTKAKV